MKYHMKKASFLILLANVVIFAMMEIYVLSGHNRNLSYLILGAQYGPLVKAGEWFRLFTSMFLHAGLLHILFNSYALYIFGLLVEEEFGPWRFLTYYLVSGLAGNVATQIFYYDSLSLGASGAIFGLIGVQFSLGLKKETPFFMKSFTGLNLLPLILFNVLYGFIPGSGVNNAAHIGGFLAGMAFGYFTHLPNTWALQMTNMLFRRRVRFSDLGRWRKVVLKELIWMATAVFLVILVVSAFGELIRAVRNWQ